MFLTFKSQEERREYARSAFIEIQFCRMPLNTKLQKVLAINNIKNWMNDSLYVSDIEAFDLAYSHILDCGIYNNLKSGSFDVFGINYYMPELIDEIIARILADKPKDYETLAGWLKLSKNYNGFYILGV